MIASHELGRMAFAGVNGIRGVFPLKTFCASAQIMAACLFALSPVVGRAAASNVPTSGEFDQVQTIVSPRLTIKSIDHVTFKGNRYKMDSVDPQTFIPYSDIDDGQSYYHYVPSSSTALRIVIHDKQPGALDELKSETQQRLQGMPKIGNAQVGTFDCAVYGKDLGNGSKVTLYLSMDPQFPYILKSTLELPATNVVQTNEIDNIKLDSPVEDGTFILPTGTKIVEEPASSPGADQSGNSEPGASAAPSPQPSPTPAGP